MATVPVVDHAGGVGGVGGREALSTVSARQPSSLRDIFSGLSAPLNNIHESESAPSAGAAYPAVARPPYASSGAYPGSAFVFTVEDTAAATVLDNNSNRRTTSNPVAAPKAATDAPHRQRRGNEIREPRLPPPYITARPSCPLNAWMTVHTLPSSEAGVPRDAAAQQHQARCPPRHHAKPHHLIGSHTNRGCDSDSDGDSGDGGGGGGGQSSGFRTACDGVRPPQPSDDVRVGAAPTPISSHTVHPRGYYDPQSTVHDTGDAPAPCASWMTVHHLDHDTTSGARTRPDAWLTHASPDVHTREAQWAQQRQFRADPTRLMDCAVELERRSTTFQFKDSTAALRELPRPRKLELHNRHRLGDPTLWLGGSTQMVEVAQLHLPRHQRTYVRKLLCVGTQCISCSCVCVASSWWVADACVPREQCSGPRELVWSEAYERMREWVDGTGQVMDEAARRRRAWWLQQMERAAAFYRLLLLRRGFEGLRRVRIMARVLRMLNGGAKLALLRSAWLRWHQYLRRLAEYEAWRR